MGGGTSTIKQAAQTGSHQGSHANLPRVGSMSGGHIMARVASTLAAIAPGNTTSNSAETQMLGRKESHRDVHEGDLSPRAISAEDAVKRMRAMPGAYNHRLLCSIAQPAFAKLDKDNKGFLFKDELLEVAVIVLHAYKPGGMKASLNDDGQTLKDLAESLTQNNEPLSLEEFCSILEYKSARVALRSASFSKFRELDSDGSGYLDRDELRVVVEWVLEQFVSLGLSDADEETIRTNFINKVDTNTDGKLDEEEFAEMFEEVATSANLMRNARAKFTELDKDGSNALEGAELEVLCEWVTHVYYPRGVTVTEYEKEIVRSKIMQNIDSNGDGSLDIQEFSALFEEITLRIELNIRARKKFLQLDTDNSGKLDVTEIAQVADWVLKLYAPNVNKDAIKANFLNKLSLNPDLKLDVYEFTTMYMQFMRVLDIKRRGSFKGMQLRDISKKGILEEDAFSPAVREVLDALSLIPKDEAMEGGVEASDKADEHEVEVTEAKVMLRTEESV